jgi:hypothetical protein
MPTNNAPVQSAPDSSIERLRAVWIHRLLSIGAPWIVGGLTMIAADRCHQAWGGHGGRTAAAVAGLASGAVVVSAAAWLTARHHPVLMRAHGAATAAVAGGWLCLATITGQRAPATAYLGIVLGITVCLTWNLRRAHKPSASGAESAAERISELLTDAAAPAGVKGARMTVREVSGRKARGLVRLVPGEQTAEDFIRRTPNLESGAKLPPGSLVASPHLDRADLAEFTLTDPRLMRQPIPWPGPSIPAGSIAEPIRPGMWQDADPVLWVITGHHVQLMGMTGAGKGFGGSWGYLGEVITREDAAVLAADITKGDQTLGPLRPALHRFETEIGAVRGLLSDVHVIIKPRTDYLASRGLQRWERGCGLTYLVLWIEEAPDILDRLTEKQMKTFESLVKALRSAGMTIALSLQRSTYDQMPTILRGQLAQWCFGVANSADAKYGLSERQDDAGAAPALWQNGQPGMAYLDAPGVPDDRITMPMRCWYWGEDAAVMTAHAARFPAADRPLDALTARLLADAAAARTKAAGIAVPAPRSARGELPGPDDEDQADETPADLRSQKNVLGISSPENDGEDEDEDMDMDEDEDEDDPETVRAEYLTEPDPDPELTAGIDDPIDVPDDEFGALTFPAPARIEPAEARERFRSQLTAWLDEGRRDFSTSDLYSLLSAVGLSRAWLHKQINAAIDDGLIEPVNDAEKGRFGRYELCEPESDAA